MNYNFKVSDLRTLESVIKDFII